MGCLSCDSGRGPDDTGEGQGAANFSSLQEHLRSHNQDRNWDLISEAISSFPQRGGLIEALGGEKIEEVEEEWSARLEVSLPSLTR